MSYISAFLTAAVVNNYVLAKGFGFTTSLRGSKNKDFKKFVLCLFVDFMAVGLIAYVVNPLMANFAYLNLMVLAVIVALVSYATDKFVNKTDYNLFLFLCLNTAVFALALNVNGLEFVDALVQILAAFAGFVLATLLLAGVASRIRMKYVPKAFHGLPIQVLAAGIISLALYAFK
ncbi:MAG: hypothetical protein Q4B60_06865 [Erysipelotrichaceae bacterium]|nr:hypothetical protein [Erysipelotrichaceae bacterium]